MKMKLITLLILCAGVIAMTACVPPEDSSNNTGAAATPPASMPLVDTQFPTRPLTPQVCTWLLYRLYTDPSVVRVGQPVRVWAYIYIDDFPSTDVLTELLVNGKMVDSKVVTITFDEAWPIYFDITPDQAGAFDISVRAIFVVNAAFANLPGGSNSYQEVSAKMEVQP
jgi:hypothetical protein